jgi:hypothetical protein
MSTIASTEDLGRSLSVSNRAIVPGAIEGGLLVEEEDAVLDVAAAGDSAGRAGAVEPAVDAGAPMTTEGAGNVALAGMTIATD